MSEELRASRAKLEAALQEYVRLTRPDVDHVYVQDYVICVASESMEEGKENMTYLNHMNRWGMPSYSVLGLLQSGMGYYTEVAKSRD